MEVTQIIGCAIPIGLVTLYAIVAFQQLLKPYYQKVSFQCIQIYYISITLGWFVSTYMPVTASFSSYEQDDKYAAAMKNLVDRYYVINHCLSCLVPELCINFLFLRYYMQ